MKKFYGHRIRSAYQYRGWDFFEFAKKIQVSLHRLGKIINDIEEPTINEMFLIARTTNFPIEYFKQDVDLSAHTVQTWDLWIQEDR